MAKNIFTNKEANVAVGIVMHILDEKPAYNNKGRTLRSLKWLYVNKDDKAKIEKAFKTAGLTAFKFVLPPDFIEPNTYHLLLKVPVDYKLGAASKSKNVSETAASPKPTPAQIKAAMKKLAGMKSVQQYIKLNKALQKMSAPASTPSKPKQSSKATQNTAPNSKTKATSQKSILTPEINKVLATYDAAGQALWKGKASPEKRKKFIQTKKAAITTLMSLLGIKIAKSTSKMEPDDGDMLHSTTIIIKDGGFDWKMANRVEDDLHIRGLSVSINKKAKSFIFQDPMPPLPSEYKKVGRGEN